MLKSTSILLLFCASLVNATENQPNILWIVTDDQRADSLACYNRAVYGTDESPLGYVESPEIDALAAEGVLFTRAIVNAPACGPSRGSMHSGRYPFRNGHYAFELTHQKADFVKPIVHQTMREYGYSTGAFGKMDSYIYTVPNDYNTDGLFGKRVHFKHDLQRNDVGDIYSHVEGGNVDGKWTVLGNQEKVMYADGRIREYFTRRTGEPLRAEDIAEIEQTNRDLDLLRAYPEGFFSKALIYGGRNPQPADKTLDHFIVKEFTDYIGNADSTYVSSYGEEMTGVPSDKPFMIEVGLRLPHTPVLPPQSYRDRFADKVYRVPEFSLENLEKLPPQLKKLATGMKIIANSPEDVSAGRAYSDAEVQKAIRDYYAFCAHGDTLIGEAVAAFKEYCAKKNEEYLIIYTVGDHGWQLGEQGIESKFSPWRQSIHNAAIVVSSDKERFPPGMVFDDIVEYVDFMPTILAAGGANLEDPKYDYLDGYDLAGVVAGTIEERPYALGEMNLIYGPRAYMRSKEFAFSMRSRPGFALAKEGTLNKNIEWALNCSVDAAELALYDLRKDPLELNNVANDPEYRDLAAWFRQKLGRIVLGDGRVECDWSLLNSYEVSNFAKGADDKKLAIPSGLVPAI
ncbi:MAG: sulfatase-like hydrolase/transferase [Coraliomargaritaceae bacterium]